MSVPKRPDPYTLKNELVDIVRPVWALLLPIRWEDSQPEHPFFLELDSRFALVRDDLYPALKAGVGALRKLEPGTDEPWVELVDEARDLFDAATLVATLTVGRAAPALQEEQDRIRDGLDALFGRVDGLFRRILTVDPDRLELTARDFLERGGSSEAASNG